MVRRRLNWFEELAGTMVQLWFQASVTWIERPSAAFVTWLTAWVPALTPVVTPLVTATAGPSGTPIEGDTELDVWAVPMEIVTCEGTNSGSVRACARL